MSAAPSPQPPTPAPKAKVGAGAGHKLGPFPVWVWVAGVAGVALYMRSKSAHKGAKPNANTATLDAPTGVLDPAAGQQWGTANGYGAGLGGARSAAGANGSDAALLAKLQAEYEGLNGQMAGTKAGSKDHAGNQSDYAGWQVMAGGHQVTVPSDYAKNLQFDSGGQYVKAGGTEIPFYNGVPLSVVADGTHPQAEADYQSQRSDPLLAGMLPNGTFDPVAAAQQFAAKYGTPYVAPPPINNAPLAPLAPVSGPDTTYIPGAPGSPVSGSFFWTG